MAKRHVEESGYRTPVKRSRITVAAMAQFENSMSKIPRSQSPRSQSPRSQSPRSHRINSQQCSKSQSSKSQSSRSHRSKSQSSKSLISMFRESKSSGLRPGRRTSGPQEDVVDLNEESVYTSPTPNSPENLRRSRRSHRPNIRFSPIVGTETRKRKSSNSRPSRRTSRRKNDKGRKRIKKKSFDPLASTHVVEHSIGLMDRECPQCGALFFKDESKSGRAAKTERLSWNSREPVPPYTTELNHFILYARDYNNAICLASCTVINPRFGRSGPTPHRFVKKLTNSPSWHTSSNTRIHECCRVASLISS